MQIYDKSRMKNSRMFYEQQAPKAIVVIMWMVLMLIISSFLFLSICKKIYTVEANGYVMSKDTTYVSSNVNGVLHKLCKQEGDYVEANETLLEVRGGSGSVEIDTLHQKLTLVEKKIEAMNLFEHSLKEEINYLSPQNEQQEYYEKMQYFELLKQDENSSNTNMQKNIDLKKQKLEELKHASKDDVDTFDMNEQEIEGLEKEIVELQQQIESVSQVAKTKAQFLSELGSSRTQLEDEKLEVKSRLQLADSENATYQLKATSSGYVHYVTTLQQGISIQMNEVLAQISMDEKEQYYVMAHIPAYERMKVDVGSKVRLEVVGMNTTIYGAIEGKIIEIDKGTLVEETQAGKMSVYQCKIDLKKTSLQKGKLDIDILRSLPVQAHIVYNEETYMDWMLGLLNFKQ